MLNTGTKTDEEMRQYAAERLDKFVLPLLKRLKEALGQEIKSLGREMPPAEFEMAVRYLLTGLLVAGRDRNGDLGDLLKHEVPAFIHALHTEWEHQVGPTGGVSIMSMKVKKPDGNLESEGLPS